MQHKNNCDWGGLISVLPAHSIFQHWVLISLYSIEACGCLPQKRSSESVPPQSWITPARKRKASVAVIFKKIAIKGLKYNSKYEFGIVDCDASQVLHHVILQQIIRSIWSHSVSNTVWLWVANGSWRPYLPSWTAWWSVHVPDRTVIHTYIQALQLGF